MLLLALLFSIFILLLSSRAITIAYIASCIAGLSWIFFHSRRASFAVAGSITIILLSAASVFINPISRYRSYQEFAQSPLALETGKLYTTSSSIRLSLWWLGVKSINKSNWVIGNGSGDAINAMKATAKKYSITNTINSYDPHNQFIYTFLTLGVVGLLALAACLLTPLLRQGISISFLPISFMGVIFILCLTESVFESQKGIVFFSLFNSLFVFQFQTIRSSQLILSHA